MSTTNGTIPRCSVPDCFSPIDFVVEDVDLHASLLAKKYCERHYRMFIVEMLDKQRQQHVLRAEQLARQIAVCNHRIKQAKLDYHVVDPLPYLHCKNDGCSFKIRYKTIELVPRDAMRTHEDYCTKKRKDAAKAAKARQPRSVKAPAGLTEDDLT